MLNPADKSTIVSIFPLPIAEEKPGIFPGRFQIAAAEGDEPSLLVVGQSIYHVDVGEDRPQLTVVKSSLDLAQSIVDDFISAQIAVTETAHPGLGWLPGEVSLSDVKTKHALFLGNLRKHQREWYLSLIEMGDDDWERYRKHSVINEIQRIAARSLNLVERAWLLAVPEELPTLACPSCGTQLPTEIVVCSNCRCVIDKEKYAKLTFA